MGVIMYKKKYICCINLFTTKYYLEKIFCTFSQKSKKMVHKTLLWKHIYWKKIKYKRNDGKEVQTKL